MNAWSNGQRNGASESDVDEDEEMCVTFTKNRNGHMEIEKPEPRIKARETGYYDPDDDYRTRRYNNW